MKLNMICGQQTDLKLSSTIYSDITSWICTQMP